jgi:hypothetical protein
VTIREDSSTPEEASKIMIWAVTRAQKILEGEGEVILVVGVVAIVVFGVVVEGAAVIWLTVGGPRRAGVVNGTGTFVR